MDEQRASTAELQAENTENNAVQEGVVAPEETDGQAQQGGSVAEQATQDGDGAEQATQDEESASAAAKGGKDGTKARQRRSENHLMKELRRKAERYDSTAGEIIRLAKSKGFSPTDADEAVEMLAAAEQGMTLEDYRQRRSQSAAEEERRVKDSPLYRALAEAAERQERELEAFRVEQAMKKDLEAIQEIDPAVKSLDELGDAYLELVAAGVTGLNAFYAIRGRQAVQTAAVPPTTGAVGGKTDTERDFTGDELDRLTKEDLEDEAVLARALRSLRKLK